MQGVNPCRPPLLNLSISWLTFELWSGSGTYSIKGSILGWLTWAVAVTTVTALSVGNKAVYSLRSRRVFLQNK